MAAKRALLLLLLTLLLALAAGASGEEGQVSVGAGVTDADEDGNFNDLVFGASIAYRDEVEGVTIRVFRDGSLYATGSTDNRGELLVDDVADGTYLWDASYEGSQLTAGGGLYVDPSRDRGHFVVLTDADYRSDMDDILVNVWDSQDRADAEGYLEVWNATDTLVSESYCIDRWKWSGRKVCSVYDLPVGNYTFELRLGENGTLLQNGTFHSNGDKGHPDSREWFHEARLELSDADGDSQNDTATIHFTADTNASYQVDGGIFLFIDRSDGAQIHYVEENLFISNGSYEPRNFSWTAFEAGAYVIDLVLLDDSSRVEAIAHYNIWLAAGRDSDEWFSYSNHYAYDGDFNGDDDTLQVSAGLMTEAPEMEVRLVLEIYQSGELFDTVNRTLTIYKEEGGWEWIEWEATADGTFDFVLTLYDEEGHEEDNYTINGIYLTQKDRPLLMPVATIDSVAPGTLRAGRTVTFNGTGSDGDGWIQSYEWKLYRSPAHSFMVMDRNFSRAFTVVGSWDVSFRVRDNDGQWSEWDTTTLVVETNQAPTATIVSITPKSAREGTPVTFVGSGNDPDGEVVGYKWTIAGVTLSTEATFTTADLTRGKHTVILSVRDNDWRWSDYTDRATLTIIKALPVAIINSISPSPAREGETIYLNGSYIESDSEVYIFRWYSNIDDEIGYRPNETVTLSPGVHNITFRVYDQDMNWSEPANATLIVIAQPNEFVLFSEPLHYVVAGVVVMLLITGGTGFFLWSRRSLPVAPPMAPAAGASLTPSASAPGPPLQPPAPPAPPMTVIECPGCQARMQVPKLGRLQSVRCTSCGLAGEIEI